MGVIKHSIANTSGEHDHLQITVGEMWEGSQNVYKLDIPDMYTNIPIRYLVWYHS